MKSLLIHFYNNMIWGIKDIVQGLKKMKLPYFKGILLFLQLKNTFAKPESLTEVFLSYALR